MSPAAARGGALRADLPAVAAIAATYAYFLLFDQFALLDLLQQALPTSGVQAAMAAMGIAGLAGSFAAAFLLRENAAAGARRMLLAGYLLAAAVAALSPFLAGAGLLAAAALAGLATAFVTVPLAAALRELLESAGGRGRHFGLRVGLGTGAAYFFCNLPGVFDAGAEERSVIAALVAAAGFAAAAVLRPASAAGAAITDAGPALRPADLRGAGLASLLASFLALVWLDSAAFAVIQENGALKDLTWSGGLQNLLLGAAHLLAALAAGWAIDRGRFRSLLFLAYLLFAAALGLLAGGGGGAALTGPLYAAAVSIYSVALVAFPAYGKEAPGLPGRRFRAALVFGVAGWIGSALGVGMAQSLHRVPPLFLLAAGLLLAAAGLFGGAGKAPRLGATLLALHGPTLLGLAAGLVFFALEAPQGTAAPSAEAAEGASEAAARGRLVYIGEGCIYCHSQYVRPGTRDEALWGPHRDLDRGRERPPLIGLRRQGPDLSNAGRRRDAEFLVRQLREPRSVAAHSAMPSYAHLFAPGDRRGEDLVAYLESLR